MATVWEGPGIDGTAETSEFIAAFALGSNIQKIDLSGRTTFLKSPRRIQNQSYVPNKLCKLCDSIFDEHRDWKIASDASAQIGTKLANEWQPHYRLDSLREWLSYDCHLCSKIVLSVRDQLKLSSIRSDSQWREKSYRTDSQGFSIPDGRLWVRVICIKHIEQVKDKYQIQICMIQDDTGGSVWDMGSLLLQSIKDSSKQIEIANDTSAESTVVQILRWMDDCKSDPGHGNCWRERGLGSKKLPSRLLDVKDSLSQGIIRLVGTRDLPIDTSYMTLSHRWGGEHSIELTPETSEDLERGIQSKKLPAVFSDAAELTFKLGCRYLWIDALCIMQDQEHLADWLKESAKMSNIYAWSTLNIAASASLSNSENMFRQRNPLAVSPLIIHPRWTCFPQTHFKIGFHTTDDPIGQQPLYQRGWVLQERILAPRAVHFADDQVYWECTSAIFSEAYPSKHDCHASALVKFRIARLEENHSTTDSFYHVWNDIRQEYGSMGFSKASDKLIGIAGLAKQFQIDSHKSLGRYLAGIWDAHLVPQLAWKVIGTSSARPPTYRAPSWSWAAIDGIVVEEAQDLDKDEDLLTVIEKSTTPIADEYGQVRAGFLIVQGSLCAATTTRRDVAFQTEQTQSNTTPKSLTLVIGNWTYLEEELSWDHISEPAYARLHDRNLFVLPIRRLQYRPTEREIQTKELRLTRKIFKAMNSRIGSPAPENRDPDQHDRNSYTTGDQYSSSYSYNDSYHTEALESPSSSSSASENEKEEDNDDDDEETEEDKLQDILALVLEPDPDPDQRGTYHRVGLLHTRDLFGSKVLEEECDIEDPFPESRYLKVLEDVDGADDEQKKIAWSGRKYIIKLV